jgi:hypothetical protein
MTEAPIVNLRTLEDLKKVLFMQRMVTRQAKEELLAVASDAELFESPKEPARLEDLIGNEFAKKAATFMADERHILEKYANNPTLTEFNLIPHLAGGTHWGATFGVTLLVGELVLEQVKAMEGKFEPLLRRLYLILLMELDKPKHNYLVEPLEKATNFKVTKPDGSPVPLEDQVAYKRRMIHHLVESYLVISLEYGIVESLQSGFVLTDLGKRVLLHLLDAEKFVTLLVEAHTRLQGIKPSIERKDSLL